VSNIISLFAMDRPYAIRKNLGGCPHYSPGLVFVFIFKSGSSSLENQYFSTWVLTVFETLKNIDFH